MYIEQQTLPFLQQPGVWLATLGTIIMLALFVNFFYAKKKIVEVSRKNESWRVYARTLSTVNFLVFVPFVLVLSGLMFHILFFSDGSEDTDAYNEQVINHYNFTPVDTDWTDKVKKFDTRTALNSPGKLVNLGEALLEADNDGDRYALVQLQGKWEPEQRTLTLYYLSPATSEPIELQPNTSFVVPDVPERTGAKVGGYHPEELTYTNLNNVFAGIGAVIFTIVSLGVLLALIFIISSSTMKRAPALKMRWINTLSIVACLLITIIPPIETLYSVAFKPEQLSPITAASAVAHYNLELNKNVTTRQQYMMNNENLFVKFSTNATITTNEVETTLNVLYGVWDGEKIWYYERVDTPGEFSYLQEIYN